MKTAARLALPALVVALGLGLAAVPSAAIAASCAPVTANARVLLSGPYDSATGLMGDALRTTGEMPTTEPYQGLGFIMRGGEAATTQLGDPTVSDPTSVVDWVLFELRDPADPTMIIATDAVPVERNGDLTRSLSFAVPAGNYYLAVEHRNHLGVMTAAPIALGSGATPSIDFTSPATQVWDRTDILNAGTPINYSGAERQIIGGVAVLWPGDADHNGHVLFGPNASDDPATIRSTVLAAPGNTLASPSYVFPAYVGSDLNMDANAIFQGQLNDTVVVANAIFLFPLNTANDPSYTFLYEQLPTAALGTDLSNSCAAAATPSVAAAPTLAATGISQAKLVAALVSSALLLAAGLFLVLRRRATQVGRA